MANLKHVLLAILQRVPTSPWLGCFDVCTGPFHVESVTLWLTDSTETVVESSQHKCYCISPQKNLGKTHFGWFTKMTVCIWAWFFLLLCFFTYLLWCRMKLSRLSKFCLVELSSVTFVQQKVMKFSWLCSQHCKIKFCLLFSFSINIYQIVFLKN